MTPRLRPVRRGERSFERLYRRHVADVYRYALVLLRDPDAAEDVTQTTFVNAYRAYARGGGPRNAHAWLLALAHAACRQRARVTTEADADLDDDLAAGAAPDEAPPTPADIRRAIARLPFNQRAALVMRELESRPYAEIAEVLGLPAAAVERLVFDGRRALREQLEGALTCHQAERAISRQIDGRLRRSERRPLRRHLRECAECAGFARSQRAQRSAWKTLAKMPVPASLQSFFGPGGVMERGAGIVAVAALSKALALAAIGGAVVGLSYEGLGSTGTRRAVSVVSAPSTPEPATARPAGRPTAAPARPRTEPSDGPAARAKPRPVAALPIAVRSPQPAPAARAPKRAAAAVPARSRAFEIRTHTRVESQALGHTERPASPPAQPPAQAVQPTTPAPSPPPAPAAPPPPPLLPQLPLPLPLPEPPKLP